MRYEYSIYRNEWCGWQLWRGQAGGFRHTQLVRRLLPESVRKQLPRGNGDWPGFDVVYYRLKCAAHKMADEPYMYLSDEHVRLMAIMGCGHEETMKAEMHRLIGRGYINLPSINNKDHVTGNL